SHGDGTALIQFLQIISAIYHGNSVLSPMSDRTAIAKLSKGNGATPSAALPVGPPQKDREFHFVMEKSTPYKTCRIALPAATLARSMEGIKRYDTFLSSSDILNALIWKTWSRTSAASDWEAASLYNVFNIRQLDELRIPRNYQGNAVLDRAATLSFGEVRNSSIAALALAYRQQIKPLKPQEVMQDIAYLARLQLEKCYGRDGALSGFQRNLYRDLIRQRGLFINDMRFINFDRVRFGDRALWFEQGQGHAQGVVSIFQYEEDILVRYSGLANETKIFADALQESLTEDFRIA
ncbi:MAG TPA: acyltransferase, partial [Spongiibacteraceae bacterium]|nr:acyltransferase [Spongiibacteraceae bacterium]